MKNNNLVNQYSHKFARENYAKKCPKNLKALVVDLINNRKFCTIENCAWKLGVLHKYVHKVFMELIVEGFIIADRYSTNKTQTYKHGAMWNWPAKQERYRTSNVYRKK